MDSIIGNPTKTVLAKQMQKKATPLRDFSMRSSRGVMRLMTVITANMAKNTRMSQPTSASERPMSAEATESKMVNTSRTLSTTLLAERVNSSPVRPILVQKKPTAIMNTSMPICVSTGAMSKANHSFARPGAP